MDLHRRHRSPSLLGVAVVFFLFPKGDEEKRLLERYHAEDAQPEPPTSDDPGDERIACSESADAFWRPSNQMKVENTDLGKQLEASALGARLWRLAPARPRPSTAIAPSEELYVLLEGSGRVRIDDEEPLTLAPLDSLLVEPGSVRQLFNDTEADQLWLVVGAPPEARQHAGDERGAAARDVPGRAEGAAAGARRLSGLKPGRSGTRLRRRNAEPASGAGH